MIKVNIDLTGDEIYITLSDKEVFVDGVVENHFGFSITKDSEIPLTIDEAKLLVSELSKCIKAMGSVIDVVEDNAEELTVSSLMNF